VILSRRFFLFFVCFFAGCAHSSDCVTQASFTPYSEARYLPKSAADRIVILASLTPERPFKEIGFIRLLKSSGCSRTGVIPDQYGEERALIKKAREAGADAVINVKAGSLGIESGIAIVFLDKK